MRSVLCLLLLCCAVACRSAPRISSGGGAATSDDSSRVAQLEQTLILALTSRDSVVLDSLLDSGFVLEGPDSTRPPVARSVFLDEVLRINRTAGPLQFGRFEELGDTADLALALTYRPGLGREGGGRVDVYWIDRWIRRGAGWRLARRQEVPQ